jgi:hypothetical protein
MVDLEASGGENTKFMTIFGRCNPKLGSKTYGLWYVNPHPPTWWTQKGMGYGLPKAWVKRGLTVL